jgi:hypothetical protein
MTSPSEAVDTIEKAMEGVTPGPWEAKENAYGAVFIYGGETLTTSVGTEYKELLAGGNSHDTLKMKNAAYIAACSPDRMREVLALARKAEAMEREMAEKENARSEQWRMRREAEASRDTERAISHALKLERDELVTAMEGVVHFGDALDFREDHLSKALAQWIAAGGAILEKIDASRALIGGDNAQG